MARIALITDTHTWQRDEPKFVASGNVLLLDHAQELHDTLLAEVGRAGVDVVLHLGDMSCGGGYFDLPAAAFPAQLRSLSGDYRALGLPVHALPGNHDCPPGGEGWSLFESLWGLGPGLGSTLDFDHARLILINAQGHDAAQLADAAPDDPVYGWVSEAELARVEEALASAQGRPVVVCIHQLLRPWGAALPMPEFYLVRNAPQVLDLLARTPEVRAVIQGHAHLYEVQEVTLGTRSVPFVIAPAVIEYPVAWLLLETNAGGLTIGLCRLPLGEGVRATIRRGGDNRWRAGEPQRQRFVIPW